jgi:hypothetical protein
MPSPLQKVPIGLLGALDLKTLGLNPRFFGETVQPTFDVRDFYLLPQLESVFTDAIGVTALGSIAAVVVPNGQTWRVRAASCELLCPATTSSPGASTDPLALSLQVEPILAAQETRIATGVFPFNGFALTAAVQFGCEAANLDLVIPSGCRIFAQLDSTVTVASDLRCSVLFQRFPS